MTRYLPARHYLWFAIAALALAGFSTWRALAWAPNSWPGMVLAFETPYYVRGLGGFIIEDQFLIGERGVEVMGEAPRDLFVAPV